MQNWQTDRHFYDNKKEYIHIKHKPGLMLMNDIKFNLHIFMAFLMAVFVCCVFFCVWGGGRVSGDDVERHNTSSLGSKHMKHSHTAHICTCWLYYATQKEGARGVGG